MESMKLNIVDLGLIDYQEALDIQESLYERVMNGEVDDTLLLLEHPAVITMGQSADGCNVYLRRRTTRKARRKGVQN